MSHVATTTWRLPPPEIYEGPDRCRTCLGARITGEQYDFNPDPDAVKRLVVDELCPGCGGCGRANHSECQDGDHVEDDPDGPDNIDDYGGDLEDQATGCPFCHGRRWWVCQGFTDTAVHHLRVPCGCAGTLLEEVAV